MLGGSELHEDQNGMLLAIADFSIQPNRSKSLDKLLVFLDSGGIVYMKMSTLPKGRQGVTNLLSQNDRLRRSRPPCLGGAQYVGEV